MNTPALSSPAGFWKRYVAYFIDVLLLWVVLELLGRLFFPTMGTAELEQLRALSQATQDAQGLPSDPAALVAQATGLLVRLTLWTTVAYAVIGGAYFAFFESSTWQATPGKRLAGIKVTDAQGARITLGRAIGRFAAASLSWLTFNIGHALAAWTPDRRALHDIVAATRVVNADPSRPQMPVWGWLVIALNALAFLALVVATMVGTWSAIAAAGQT